MQCILLNDLCFELCYSYPDSALEYGRRGLSKARELNNSFLIGASYNRIGIVYDIINSWDTSFWCYEQAAVYASQCMDTITLASAYNNMGLICWNKAEYDRSVDYYIKSLDLFRLIGKQRGVANTYNNLSLIYWEQDILDKALDYQIKALAIRQEIDDQYGIGASYVNLGLLYHGMDSLDRAIEYHRKAMDIKLRMGNDDHGLAITYTNLGVVLSHMEILDSAKYYFELGAKLHESNGNFSSAASSYLNAADVERKRGDHTGALKILQIAEGLALKAENSDKIRIKIYHGLADENYDLGNYHQAAEYYRKRIDLKDSIFSTDKYEKLLEVETRYETEKKDRQIAELKIQKASQDLVVANHELLLLNRENWLYAFSILLLLVLVLALIIIFRTRSRNASERNRLLLESKQQSLVAVFDATESERQRIAKDLHDGIGQQMSGVKLAWSKLEEELSKTSPEYAQRIKKLSKLLDQSANDLRTISHEMMPRVLTEMGLIEAIQDMLDKSLSFSDIHYSFDHYNLEGRLPKNIEVALFRVCQELINNILKHSGATKVSVQLFRNKDQVILMVEDNGNGLSVSGSSDGHGFTNIRSRLDVINGSFSFEPSFEKGMVATIRVNIS